MPAAGGDPPGAALDSPDRAIADMAGPAALPRKNGELVFAAAWEGRLFGMTLALQKAGRFHWNEFRDRLIEEIAAADRRGDGSSYYERWFRAFERLLEAKGLVPGGTLAARLAEFQSGERDDVF
jgi:nitrile hydratase accessory protein